MQRSTSSAVASTSQLTLDRLDSKEIDYARFCEVYLKGNRPCIFSPALVSGWSALVDWKSCDEGQCDNKADDQIAANASTTFDRLAACYADHVAPVVIGFEEERREMSLPDAVKLVKEGHHSVYIKDWHFVRQESTLRPQNQSRPPYGVPDFFADDWMNNRTSEVEDDFRFCYAGTAGTRTNIHRDVYTSYSWSTNVLGKKLWRLFPPETKTHLRKYPSVSTSELASSVDQMQVLAAQGKLGHVKDGKEGWPEWSSAFENCIEVIQESIATLSEQEKGSAWTVAICSRLDDLVQILLMVEGETIFVPSDWLHEVTNLTDCISINHNWCNSTNIVSMYRSMCEEVEHVEEALSDVHGMMKERGAEGWQAEWTATVQQVLASNAGWAWAGFWNMVEHNLRSQPCQASLRPSLAYISAQLLPCVADFSNRHDYPLLSQATRVAAANCKLLLKGST